MMHRPLTHCCCAGHGCCASQPWMQLPPSLRHTRSARVWQRCSSRRLMNAARQMVRVVVHAAWQKRTRCACERQPRKEPRHETAGASVASGTATRQSAQKTRPTPLLMSSTSTPPPFERTDRPGEVQANIPTARPAALIGLEPARRRNSHGRGGSNGGGRPVSASRAPRLSSQPGRRDPDCHRPRGC